MEAHRISSSPAPPGVQLSTIVVPATNVHGGGPLSNPSSGTSLTAPTSVTVSNHIRTSPPPPIGMGNNLSLASNRGGGPGATFNSWDGGCDTSNLTFSQVSPGVVRQFYLVESERAFHGPEANDALSRDEMSPLMTKMSPRKRSVAAVRFADFEDGGGLSALDSKPNVGHEQRSVSWHPQGLFGAALERFQTREAASRFNVTTASMGGTVLAADVPEDLPPEPSTGAPRRLSGPSVHAIQFDTDYGGSVTPFMSISSPGLSRRSISFPRMSVPRLSAGSMLASANSFERDAAPLMAGDETRTSLPPSSVASPAFNNQTVAAEHTEVRRSTQSPRAFHPRGDSETPLAFSPLTSPSTATARFPGPRSVQRLTNSATSHLTTATATTVADEEGETTLENRDFLLAADSESPSLPAGAETLSAPPNLVATMNAAYTPPPLVDVEEQRARAKVEFAERVEFNKLRSMQVSQALAQAQRTRAEERRTSKYAGDGLLRQLEREEREQLNGEMRGRMRAAEAQHQQTMRVLREQEPRRSPLSPAPPPLPLTSSDGERILSRVASSRRKVLDGGMTVPHRFSASQSHRASVVNALSSPLPPLSSQQMSRELRNTGTSGVPNQSNNMDAELFLEIVRQRDLKHRTSLRPRELKLEDMFRKFV